MLDVEVDEKRASGGDAATGDAERGSADLTVVETACTAAGGMAIAVAGLYFLAPICFSC